VASLDEIIEITIGVAAGGIGFKFLPDLFDRLLKWFLKKMKKKYRKLKKDLVSFHSEVLARNRERLRKRLVLKRMIRDLRESLK